MPDCKEVELKLTCDAADFATLQDWPRLTSGSSKATDDLESVYFDTSVLALHKAGYVLRVRKTRDGYLQTAKAEGDGLIERNEWERPVKGPKPNLTALTKTPLAEILGKKPELKPLFTVAVERATFLMEYGVSEIEVALDRGRITKPGSEDSNPSEFVCEVELELKRGTAADIFRLAREISAFVPVRLGVKSKSERGFELDDAQQCDARKAEPVILSKDMSAAEAFRAVAHACLRHMRVNEDILIERRDPDALHQMRVAIRRLRSAFSLFRVLLRDDPRYETIKAELKRLSAPLGRGRNLDVFLSRTLPDEISRHPDQVELLNLEKQFETERTEAYAAVDQRLRSGEWRAFCIDLVAWINAGRWLDASDAEARDEPVAAFATRVLDKTRRQLKKRGRNLADLDPEGRHQARIAAKKLRYGTEFFASLYSAKKKAKQHREFADALADMQNALGTLNDIATGQDLLEGLADAQIDRSVVFAAGLTAAEGDGATASVLADASRTHKNLIEARPFWR